ncbi:MAG: TerB family tellurite resistance protein [Rhodospirillales bacterium]
MSPLFALGASLAYMIRADGETKVEERATFLTVFGKQVTSGTMTSDQLQMLTAASFRFARQTPLKDFLIVATPRLSFAQRMAIFMNIYETVLVDGMIREGEKRMLHEFEQHFGISREKLRAVRELLMLKNDTSLFTDEAHPQNESGYSFDLIFIGSGDDMDWSGRTGQS